MVIEWFLLLNLVRFWARSFLVWGFLGGLCRIELSWGAIICIICIVLLRLGRRWLNFIVTSRRLCSFWRALWAIFVEDVELLAFTNTLNLVLGWRGELLLELLHHLDTIWLLRDKLWVRSCLVKLTLACFIAKLLEEPVAIFRPEVVNPILAIGHLADGKLAHGDVRLLTGELADRDHEFGDQITIGTWQSWHFALAGGHGHCMLFKLELAAFKKHHLIIEVTSFVLGGWVTASC